MRSTQGSQDRRCHLFRNPLLSLVLSLAAFGMAASTLHAAGTLSGKVRNLETGEGMAGVTIMTVAVGFDTFTDSSGRYSMELPAGRYTLLVLANGFQTTQETVTVMDGSRKTLNFELETSYLNFADEVVVLGARTARTAYDSAVPIDVLSEDELESTGMTETSRMIQYLAPSFNHSTSTVSDGTDIVRPSTLRGLNPDQTLVLVNGKRRHNSALVHVNGSIGRGSAGVDLNAIPASAIERVEILRDGAAAQYGSDAIAGVMNIQLNTGVDTTHLRVQGGQHFEGDGEVIQFSASRGFRVAEEGFVNATFEFRERSATNRAGKDPRRIYNFTEQTPGAPALPSGSLDTKELTYDRLNHRYGDAKSENLYFFLNSEIPVGENGTLYFFGGIAAREGESAGFNRLPSQSRTNVALHPDGHLPLINTDVNDNSISVGYQTPLSSWSLDSSVTYGRNDFEFFISNSANTSLGPGSPTSANAGKLEFGQLTFNLDLLRSFEWGLATPVSVAAGVEIRQDQYKIGAGEEASWVDGGAPNQFGGTSPAGIQVFPGFRPTNERDETRENIGVYAELESNLTERLLVGAAGRYENYSDFGNNVSGKLTSRFDVTSAFALRGSVNSGFRAPSLHQSNFNNSTLR